MADLNREALIKEAIKLGKSRDMLDRVPVYVIAQMVNEENGRKTKPPKVHERIRQAQERIQHQATHAAPVEPEDLDETKTVVDMSYMTEHTNPADQKYARFKFLAAAKKDLMHAIKQNTNCLQVNIKMLDEDDVQMVQKEISAAQARLHAVNTEMGEIHQWFQEVQVQRQTFYQQFLQSSTDVTGDMTHHFQRKLENIQKYLQAMQPPAANSE